MNDDYRKGPPPPPLPAARRCAGAPSLRAYMVDESEARPGGAEEAALHIEAALWLHECDEAGAVERGIERALQVAQHLPAEQAAAVREMVRMLLRTGEATEREIALCAQTHAASSSAEAVVAATTLLEGAWRARTTGQLPVAIELTRRARQLRPQWVQAAALEAQLHGDHGDAAAQAESWESLADLLAREERAALLCAAARRREAALGQRARADALHLRALDADPRHWPALVALHANAEQGGRWADACAALERLAAVVDDDATRARLHYRAGVIYHDWLDDLPRAARQLSLAADALPEAMPPLSRLAEIYELQDRPEPLAETLSRLADLAWDAPARATLLTRLAELRATCGEATAAAANCGQALAAAPGYLPAIQLLSIAARAAGDLEALLPMLRSEAEGMAVAPVRAQRALDLGDVYRELGRTDAAIDCYRRAIEIEPTHHLAFGRLESVLQEQGRAAELLRVLEQRTRISTDDRSQSDLLRRRARLLDAELRRHGEAQRLDQLAARQGSGWGQLATLLQFEDGDAEHAGRVLALAEQTCDASEEHWLRVHAAALLLAADQPLPALQALAPLLDRALSPAVVRLTASVYQQLRRWSELYDLFGRLRDGGSPLEEPTNLLYRMARVAADWLDAPDRAVDLLQVALRHDPCSRAAQVALERLLRRQRMWPELVETLQQRAATEADPVRRADALHRAAELAEMRLADGALAAELYEQAVDCCRDATLAADGWARLLLREQRWSDGVELLSRSPAEGGAGGAPFIALECLWVQEDRLGEQASSAQYIALARSHPLLRAETHRVLQDNASEDLPWWLLWRADHTREPGLACSLLTEGAEQCMRAGHDAPALAALRRAAELDPHDPIAHSSLEALLLRVQNHAAVAQLRLERAERQRSRMLQLHLMCQAADAAVRAQDDELGVALLRRCLAREPDYLPALLRLADRLTTSSDVHERHLARCCDRIARCCRVPLLRAEASRRAAAAWARVGDSTRELESLQRLFGVEPDDRAAFARMGRLLCASGQHGELAVLYEQRIACCEEAAQRADLLLQHARLLHGLEARDAAQRQLELALRLVPGHPGALRALVDLLREAARWTECALLLGALIDSAPTAPLRRTAQLEQASIWLGRLGQPARAVEVLRGVLAREPADREALSLLVRAHLQLRELQQALDRLTEAARHDDPRLRIWALTELGELMRSQLRDEHRRHQAEMAALEQALADPELVDFLVGRYRERQQLPRLYGLSQTLLGSRPDVARRRSVTRLVRRLFAELRRNATPARCAAAG